MEQDVGHMLDILQIHIMNHQVIEGRTIVVIILGHLVWITFLQIALTV